MNALIALIIFIAVASPTAFKTTRGFLGDWIASPEGLATFKGLFLHGIVFLFVIAALNLLLGEKSRYQFETRDAQDDQNNTYFQKNRLMNF